MPKYTVIVEEANGNYSAFCPDLPGCVATGKDENETLQRMREAIAFHLEGLREQKAPLPQTRCSVREIEIPG